MNRREFLAGAAVLLSTGGESGCRMLPGTSDVLPAWRSGQFQAHFIYTGVAESVFLIFPDGTSMLLDCGDIPAIMRHPYDVPVPRPREMAGETVANYVLRVNPRGKNVDYMVVSHFHSDHTGTPCWQSCGTMVDKSGDRYWRSGFGIALEKLRFLKAIDRGYPDYSDPIPLRDGRDRELEHMKRIYAYLKERDGLEVEKFRVGDCAQIRPMHQPVPNFRVRNVAANGKIAMPDGTIRDLYRDYLAKHSVTRLNENGMSLGLVFEYGSFRFYTAGDFCDRIDGFQTEDAMAEAVGAVDVAKIDHHGHHSMSPKLVAALRARQYVACIWDQLHVTDDTMTRLADRTAYSDKRMLFPGVFTAERQREDASRPWTSDVAEAVKTKGAHVVLTVERGGESYSLTCVDAASEDLRVKAVYSGR